MPARKDRKHSLSHAKGLRAGATPPTPENPTNEESSFPFEGQSQREEAAHVEVAPEEADGRIASGQAEPVEGQKATHELFSI